MSKIIISEGVSNPETVRKQIMNAPYGFSKFWINAVDITISNGDFYITKKGEDYAALEK